MTRISLFFFLVGFTTAFFDNQNDEVAHVDNVRAVLFPGTAVFSGEKGVVVRCKGYLSTRATTKTTRVLRWFIRSIAPFMDTNKMEHVVDQLSVHPVAFRDVEIWSDQIKGPVLSTMTNQYGAFEAVAYVTLREKDRDVPLRMIEYGVRVQGVEKITYEYVPGFWIPTLDDGYGIISDIDVHLIISSIIDQGRIQSRSRMSTARDKCSTIHLSKIQLLSQMRLKRTKPGDLN